MIMSLTEDIQKVEKHLAELKAQKEVENSKPKEKKLAELLHSRFCNQDHMEVCDWHYGSWDKPTHAHSRYLQKAEKALEMYDEGAILGAFLLMDEVKKL